MTDLSELLVYIAYGCVGLGALLAIVMYRECREIDTSEEGM